jgi:hypothetical protein
LRVGSAGEGLRALLAERVAVSGAVPALTGALLDEAHADDLSCPPVSEE